MALSKNHKIRMTFFPDPIKPSEGRAEDDLIVSPIQADKKDKNKDKFLTEFPPCHKKTFYGAIMSLIKKISTLLIQQNNKTTEVDILVKNTLSLKNHFDQLKEIDQNDNPAFTQSLSHLWHELLQQVHVATNTHMETKIDLFKLKIVLTDINNYPPNKAQKLGFYLNESIGKDWLPIPFLEILKNLHTDYKINHNESVLQHWITLLTESLNFSK